MTDKILVDSNFDYKIFNEDGYDYKAKMLSKQKTYKFSIFLGIVILAITLALGYSTYYCFTNSHPGLGILSLIGCLLFLVGTLHVPQALDDEHTQMEYATAQYNKALVDNQDAILQAVYSAKEKHAKHEANLKNIKMEKSLSFVREVEVEK